jgi:hypothetical protein
LATNRNIIGIIVNITILYRKFLVVFNFRRIHKKVKTIYFVCYKNTKRNKLYKVIFY